jgi:hypothetical protein
MAFSFRSLVSAWMAVWFALASVDPGWLHACPMHGRGAVESAPADASAIEPERHASHHGSHGAAHDTTEDGPAEQPQHGSHQCACLGDCNSATAGIALAAAVGVPAARVVAAPATAPTLPLSAGVHREALLLPFATAPPVRAL